MQNMAANRIVAHAELLGNERRAATLGEQRHNLCFPSPLLAGAVYGPRDGEQALGFKIATTLMLFSFVLLAVLWPSVTPSAALAATR